MDASCIALSTIAGATALVPIVCVLNPRVSSTARETSAVGAVEALARVAEFAKWMALIETAAIGGLLNFFLKPSEPCQAPSASACAVIAIVLLGVALFVCAWLLSATPSLEERLAPAESSGSSSAAYNFSGMPLYDWFSDTLLRHLTVSVMLVLAHWYWALGLLFALFAVAREIGAG